MWESEGESHAGERGLVPVGGSSSSGRQEALKNDGFVRRDQSWYIYLAIYVVLRSCI